MKLKFNLIIGFLFIAAGVLLCSDQILQYVQKSNAQPVTLPKSAEAKSKIKTASQVIKTALPTHIDVPATGVSVDIEPGYYNFSDNTWTISDVKANFATITSVPNSESGNTYIYGHNKVEVFAKLNNAKIGDEAKVINSEGKTFVYKLVQIKDVKPDDLSLLLEYQGKPILTLQTCSGFFDQYRRLFIFDYESEA